MKAIILCAGKNETQVLPKPLLHVYDQPIVVHTIRRLHASGFRDIAVVIDPSHADVYMRILEQVKPPNTNLFYIIQSHPNGSAAAVAECEGFIGEDAEFAVCYGDCVFQDTFEEYILHHQSGALIATPGMSIEDSLDQPITQKTIEEDVERFAGFGVYDRSFFEKVKALKKENFVRISLRDINLLYAKTQNLGTKALRKHWMRPHSADDLLEAAFLAQEEAVTPPRPFSARRTIAPDMPLVSVGLLTYNSAQYVIPAIRSLQQQSYKNLEIHILDNNSTDNTVDLVKDYFPEVNLIESQKNLGFSSGHNRIINESTGKYYLCLNIDMMFEPHFTQHLVTYMESHSHVGSVGGKIKQWDFDAYQKAPKGESFGGKTNIIDSMGVKIFASHRFIDIGQGEVDIGQFEEVQERFGISGAAVMFRQQALDDIAYDNGDHTEYFDEAMFLYKEDVDLAYRLQWGGWRSVFIPQAVAYHHRSIRIAKSSANDVGIVNNRNKKAYAARMHSYLNHQILLRKNFSPHFSSRIKWATSWYNTKAFFYLLICEPKLLLQWGRIWGLRRTIKAKKKALKRRVSQREIESLIKLQENY